MGQRNDSVHGLITEIRHLAQGRMDAWRINEIEEEVRAHLDASIQARIELGSSSAEAEISAVASFGDVRAFVESVAARSNQRRITRTAILSCVFVVGLTLMAVVQAAGGSAFDGWFQATIIVAAIGSLWMGLDVTADLKKKCLKAFLLSIPLSAIVLSFAMIGTPNPLHAELRSYIGSPIDVAAMRSQDEARFQDLKSKVIREMSRRAAPYKVPIIWEYERVVYKQASSKAEAAKILDSVEKKMEDRWDRSAVEVPRYAERNRKLLSTPFLVNVFYLLPLATIGVGVFSSLLSAGFAIGRLARTLVKRLPGRHQGFA